MTDRFNPGYALLVGVGATANPNLSLPVTVKDVQAVQGILTDVNLCAYHSDRVRLLHDGEATREAILAGLDWLNEQAIRDPEATIVFYYSGHGVFNLSEQIYYLIPHDFDRQSIAQTSLSATMLAEKLGEIAAKRLWAIVDSCHAEGMTRAKDGLPADFLATALPKGTIDDLKRGEGRAVFASSRGNQQSWVLPDNSLSLYTHHLIEALRGAANQAGDRYVTLGNIQTHLGKTVSESALRLCQAEQTPFFETATEDFPVALLRGGKGLSGDRSQPDLQRIMTDAEVATPALKMAQRSLAILEEQVAGFGKLQVPAHLRLDLEEKRKEVAELEKRVRNQ